MVNRHVRLAETMLAKVEHRLSTLDVEELTATECARWADVAAKVQRLALQPDRQPVNRGDDEMIDVTSLTEDERRGRLVALRAELDRRLALSGGMRQAG